MSSEEAGRVVAVLTAIFWRDPIERATVEFWVAKISELDRVDAAMSAAEGFGLNADRFPTLREFLLAYRAEAERLRPPALEEGPRLKPPEWVLVWQWLRNQNDYRTLPQQEGWDLASDRLTAEQYEQQRQRWLADTGGKSEVRLPSVGAL